MGLRRRLRVRRSRFCRWNTSFQSEMSLLFKYSDVSEPWAGSRATVRSLKEAGVGGWFFSQQRHGNL